MTDLAYSNIKSEHDLIKWSQSYIDQSIEEYDFCINQDWIRKWEVSKRAKKRAACIVCVKIPDAVIGEQIDWDYIHEKYKNSFVIDVDCIDYLYECKIILSWNAFESFTESQWKKILRHEMVHIEQIQLYGKTNHKNEFKERVQEVDTVIDCQRFVPFEYILYCSECDKPVIGRYKKSKYVKHPEMVQSDCCNKKCYAKQQNKS